MTKIKRMHFLAVPLDFSRLVPLNFAWFSAFFVRICEKLNSLISDATGVCFSVSFCSSISQNSETSNFNSTDKLYFQ